MTDQQELAALHQSPVEAIGPTGDAIALCLSTATHEQLHSACAAIQKEMIKRAWAEAIKATPFVSVEPIF